MYAAEAGRAGVPAADWLTASATARAPRTLAVGLAFAAFGLLTRRFRRHYVLCLALLGGAFTIALTLIVTGWR